MDCMSEVKFSDLQNDERFKKLERTLKLSYLRKGVRLDESWCLPMSSINMNASDVNSNVPVPRASRIGSEIVSSSNNLRNIVLKKDAKNTRQTMCTSSIRDFNSTNGLQEDYFMMPPPNSNFISRASEKANSTPLNNVPRTALAFESKSINKQSPKETNSSPLQISPNKVTQHAENRIRIFTRWKVKLNEQGQLVIQGIINSKHLARSKPIAKRLTPTKTLSILNHVYQLEGNIVDNECELPDYVRGKFYNGFPDDWENVHHIWQLYKQQGSRLTFRWPTPITDSDDDLKSEVTDLSFANTQSMNITLMNSFNDLQTHRNKENLSVTSLNVSKDNQQYMNKEHSMELAAAVAEFPYGDDKTNNLKDKLNIIVNSIADKNCSHEFVSNIIKIVDCLSYVVSYGSSKENESNMNSSTLVQDESVEQEQRKDVSNDKATPSHNDIDFKKNKSMNTNIHLDKSTACNDSSLKFRNPSEANNCMDKDSSNSESDVYIGIPRISAERILQQRKILKKICKRKARSTKLLQRHCDVLEKKQSSSINTDNINHRYFDDSSVSIIRAQTEFSEVETLANSKVVNNVNNYINLGKTIRSQCRETNISMKEINPPKVKELVQENPTTLHKLTENSSDSSDTNENNISKINETLGNEDAISETNFRKETSDKQSYNVLNNIHQASRNTSKPIMLSSVPVDISKMYKEIKQAKYVDRDSRGSEKEVQYLTKAMSPVKIPNALKNIDSDFSICSDREEQQVEKLTNWTPNLICEPELCLCFEGKLLNDAGHVVNRRFKTDAVLRRVSLTLIETISHKFYKLVGDFNNYKNVIPKQLLNKCRYGCPASINLFCKMWKSLQSDSNTENTLDAIDIPMSSKGRKMIRPLDYWMGERCTMRYDNLVYSPGFDQDSSMENMNKRSTNSKHMKESKSPVTYLTENKTNKSIVNCIEKVECAKSEVVRRKKKSKLAPRLSNSCYATNGKSSPVRKRKRFTEPYATVDEEDNPRKLSKNSWEKEETKRITRSNAKPVTSSVHIKKISTNRYSSSAGNRCSENYLFCRSKPRLKEDDTLSEDQESYVQ